jgi:hypothetical protein
MKERERSHEILEPRIADDFAALREDTAQNIPGLPRTVANLTTRPLRGHGWKEQMMSMVQTTRSKPWLVTGLGIATVALALLVIPVSYERVTGHQVSLSLSGASPDQMPEIAKHLKSALGVEHVMVKAEAASGAEAFTFEASVPRTKSVDPDAVVQAFARELNARGFHAEAASTPIRERVSTNVYAYAADQVIRVETSGKSAAQIETEIRQQLADAGITNTNVSVTDMAPGKREVKVMAHHEATTPGATEPPNLRLELTKDGQPVTGSAEGVMVEIKKLRSASGETLQLDVSAGGRSAKVEIPNSNTMSDAALAETIRAELAKQGLGDLQVTVSGGHIQIEKR